MNIYILDVGRKIYGDCIVITHEGKIILIDGAHPGDQNLLLAQIGKILNSAPPFKIDLLVVTHCHQDHIGCLPRLISDGNIIPQRALVADEKLGFGRTDDGVGPTDAPGLNRAQQMMIMAVQEEDHSGLPDNELANFLEDGITLEKKYNDMLETMKNNGCTITRYGSHTTRQIKTIETSFKKFGLKILGPSKEHLITCASVIAGAADSFSEEAFDNISDDSPGEDLVTIYRQMMDDVKTDAALEDSGSQASAAKNDQSIVIKVAANGWAALLAGDMQYASAGVQGMNGLMATALQEAAAAGPYQFIKLMHHTASNGFNQKVFTAFAPCTNFAHTGGIDDAGHPNKKVLEVLKAHQSQIKFLRTDRNGMITVKKDTKVRMIPGKGNFNDFSTNPSSDNLVVNNPEVAEKVVVRQEAAHQDGFIEITARIPVNTPRVSITIEIDTEKKKPDPVSLVLQKDKLTSDGELGGGRSLPPLLFVTCKEKLEKNIGIEEARLAISIIRNCVTATLLEIPFFTEADKACIPVHEQLKKGTFEGVVIVGGYDVVPAKALNVLNDSLRKNILDLKGRKDPDNFIVWSDDVYVDLDSDTLPELPVCRIPDGRMAGLVLTALTSSAYTPGKTFGIRNIERPFADDVYKSIVNNRGSMFVSETFGPLQIEKDAALGAVYYMLHGYERDSTLFSGETIDPSGGDNELFDAVSVANVPANASGSIVFAGCCWGALTVFPKASLINKHTLSPKSPEDSIALTYLLNGAQAFVGCTGTHYSPGQEPFNYYGRPMHDLFWQHISKGVPPARALWQAKKIYSMDVPHNQMDVFSQGIEHKILRQFTCLGLGW